MKEGKNLESADLARVAADAASDKQASDIVVLDLRSIASFTDFFVLCSAQTDRQIDAVREEIEEVLKQAGARLHHAEGTAESGWVLLDFVDVVVHIFAPAEREYYELDRVWDKATVRLRIQ